MERDPIVEEVRAIRDAFAKEHGYNLKAIVAALQDEQAESGRPVVSLPPKRLPDTHAERRARAPRR
ncbi:MAG TPA: hypothetical protein VNJ70_17100 [Thermoanaerobaculia bacterium]|nr:hypothetical protein [Thermoanaerobaculia bacterium]